MPEPKFVKNRLLLDLNVTTGRSMPLEERKSLVDQAAERLLGLGATLVRRTEEYGSYYVVLQDPEGNEFCAH